MYIVHIVKYILISWLVRSGGKSQEINSILPNGFGNVWYVAIPASSMWSNYKLYDHVYSLCGMLNNMIYYITISIIWFTVQVIYFTVKVIYITISSPFSVISWLIHKSSKISFRVILCILSRRWWIWIEVIFVLNWYWVHMIVMEFTQWVHNSGSFGMIDHIQLKAWNLLAIDSD